MIKLWFVPEILVLVREMSLKFDFWGRHACVMRQEVENMVILQDYTLVTRYKVFCSFPTLNICK